MRLKNILVLLLLASLCIPVWAQTDYQQFYTQSLKTNNTGMFVLGSWAIANMATGAVGWANSSGQRKYFHQMNLFWNTVNLSIAGIALYNNLSTEMGSLSGSQMLQNHIKTENLYIINAGLDVLYIGAGFFLKNYAIKKPEKHNLFTGYGNSVILQGSFLLLFDLIMAGIQQSHRMDFVKNMSIFYQPDFNVMQVAFSIPLN
ncbi:hypothetical protein SAMN05444280_11564 [Tangfeifania diversioriginum]|uniref:Uncharacterized protein n=1 Tax=Tangfeifania diversioriginum TaxID=1168035 RepID=A0A1M6I2P4_9BACT|nr:hypothetical protein [Tangfeifania diversioriginum]SHJ28741.1 hypothetical protein SAMN05444280_11564 [Tangfeifania diversioriginum]